MEARIRKEYDSARSLEKKGFQSACYAPFVSLFFTTQGRVLACCKNGSFVLGNVQQQRLREIWNGEKIERLRRALREYRFDLDCGFCEWDIRRGNYQGAAPLLFDELPVQSTVPEWPVQIEFEGSNTCNFECIMCNGETSSSIRAHRDGLPPLPAAYPDEFFEDLRSFLPHLKRARFFGGEPFLTRESERIWEMMIEEGLSTECHVTTNGSQFHEKVERLLDALPFHLVVSMDGATKETLERIRVHCRFEQMVENVGRFHAYTKRRGTSFHLAFCLMRQNWHEFGDLLLFAEDLGVEVWINTVIDPSFCSIYTLPRNDLVEIADCLEKQGGPLASRLYVNRKAWDETILKLRRAANEPQTDSLAGVLRRYYVPDDPVQRASRLIQEGRYGEALEMARTVPEKNPCFYYALDLRGYCRSMLADLEGAEQELNQALHLSQKRPEAYLNLARIRLKQNSMKEALEYAHLAANGVMEEDRVEYGVCELLAFLYAREGRIVLALKALGPIARLQAGGSLLRGLVYPKNGLRMELLAEVEGCAKSARASLVRSFLSFLLMTMKNAFRIKYRIRALLRPIISRPKSLSKRSSDPLVSIVTAFFNAERFLQEAIDSVLSQGYKNWEFLLVDDGSTDGGGAIARRYAEEYPQKVYYIEHPNHENRGAAASRNVGVRRARGKYVAILDADDVWLPHKLEQQVAILEATPRAAMVCGVSLYWHSWTGKPEDRELDSVPGLGIELNRLYEPPELLTRLYPLGHGGAPCPSDILLRRNAMEPDGGFQEDFRGLYQLYEDQVFLTKLYLKRPVFVSTELWDKYRIHPNSCVSAVTAAGKYDTVRQAFLNWFEKYLLEQGMKDTSVWTALRKSRAAYAPGARQMLEKDLRRGKWSLRVAGGNLANLLFPSGKPDQVRIEIAKWSPGAGYDIQLNQPRLKVFSNTRYVLKLRARADGSRTMLLGFAKASAPWTNLGFYKRLDLNNGRIHFDLGESDVAVELSSVVLSKIGEPASSIGSAVVETKKEVRQASSAGQSPGPYKTSLAAGAPVNETIEQTVGFDEAELMAPVSSDWGWDRGLPVDRYYIEAFLSCHANDIRGSVLEIGADWYTRKFGGDRLTQVEILDINQDNPRATIVADLARVSEIPAGKFDCVIVPQTLQFIYDVGSAILSLHKMLKPGGVLLATLPGATRTRIDDPSGPWYWGFTTASAQQLFQQVFSSGNVEVRSYGNLLAAVSFLRGLASEELSQKQLDSSDTNYQVLVCVRAVRS